MTIMIMIIITIILNIMMMVTREEGLPEELVALMEDMKSSQKKANTVHFGIYKLIFY